MNTILAIADREGKKHAALHRALQLARVTGARLQVVGFAYAKGLDSNGVVPPEKLEIIHKALIDEKNRELRAVLAQANTAGVDVHLEIVWQQDVAAWVNERCHRENIDLVVKTGHRSESWFYTSTDWQLIRECPAPVLIVASKSWKKKTRILAALDLNTRTESKQRLNGHILQEAGRLAAALGDDLHCGYCIELPTILADMDIIEPRQYAKKVSADVEPTIQQLSERYNIPRNHFHLKAGRPDRVIPSIANQLKADLVVVGTVGRRGIKGKLLGNTAEGVLSKLRTDILAIKPS